MLKEWFTSIRHPRVLTLEVDGAPIDLPITVAGRILAAPSADFPWWIALASRFQPPGLGLLQRPLRCRRQVLEPAGAGGGPDRLARIIHRRVFGLVAHIRSPFAHIEFSTFTPHHIGSV